MELEGTVDELMFTIHAHPTDRSMAARTHHIATADLERYHLGRVYEIDKVVVLEEHLLWCQECLERLDAIERLIDQLRTVLILCALDRETNLR